MPTANRLIPLIPLILAGVVSSGQPLARAQCDVTAISDQAQAITAPYVTIDGSSLWLESTDSSLGLTAYYGVHDEATVLPIASSTKLLSAVVISSLVDEGFLTLETPVGDVLPEFQGLAATMTVRQLFSHTSGLPGQSPILSDSSLTLAEAVSQIAATVPLLAPPGTQFYYGGVSMHVAGRMAEVVTGEDWEDLFQSRVATPLGLTSTDYQGLGPTSNYRIAGGARSSVADYQRVLRMLRDGGVAPDGTVVLSSESVAAMFADQTQGVPIVSSPFDDVTRYGLGVWRDRVSADGTAVRISSPGAFGCTPWIDVDLGVAGLFFVDFVGALLRDDTFILQDLVRDESLRCLPLSPFQRGDANGDGVYNVADPVRTLAALFVGASVPCRDAADANDDGALDLADSIFTLSRLFMVGSPPPPPFPECGPDPTPDDLGCTSMGCP